MAIRVNAGDVRRSDLFVVDPFKIIVKEELRGRRFPPTSEQIVEMAMSIFDNGQRQPIECRRVEDNQLQSTAGFTRINAIRLIREGFVGTDGVQRHDPEFRVQVKIVDCNDEGALVNNIVENAHRNQTSDIDDAHNQNSLRTRYGYDDTKIANLYQYKTPVKVGRLRKLLQLSSDEQLLVHTGVLGTQAAIDLLELPANKRAELVSSLNTGGKINGSDVADQVRQHILADSHPHNEDTVENHDDGDEDKKRYKARSMRNVRQFFDELKASDEPAVSRFASDVLKWVSGKTTDKAMSNAVERLMNAERMPKNDVVTDAAREAA